MCFEYFQTLHPVFIQLKLIHLEFRMVSGILEVLDGCFTLTGSNTDETKNQQKSLAIEVATVLLTLPTPTSVQHHTKSLLSALHTSKAAYHNYKDFALLNHAYLTLQKFKALGKPTDIDPEAFYRLVLTIRSVAVARPNNLIKFAENLPIVEITSPTSMLSVTSHVNGMIANQFLIITCYRALNQFGKR